MVINHSKHHATLKRNYQIVAVAAWLKLFSSAHTGEKGIIPPGIQKHEEEEVRENGDYG